jgi:hypothetical protein
VSPRFRTLKPEIWQDERMGELSLPSRLLFVGLITQADDDGRLRGGVRLLSSLIFPYDSTRDEFVEQWLSELVEAGLIDWYEHTTRRYVSLPNWDKHQRVDKRYYRESDVPSPDSPEASRQFLTDLRERSAAEGKGREGIGKEGKGQDRNAHLRSVREGTTGTDRP